MKQQRTSYQIMTTLLRYNARKIRFGRPWEDRALPLVAMIVAGYVGLLFTNSWIHHPPEWNEWPNFLSLIVVRATPFVGVGVVFYFLRLVLLSEDLKINLRDRTYKARRGLLIWCEILRGDLSDFDTIQVVSVPADDGSGLLFWVVEWVWRDETLRPFRVDSWRRAKSFRLLSAVQESDRLSFLSVWHRIATDVGIPLVVPKAYSSYTGYKISGTDDAFFEG